MSTDHGSRPVPDATGSEDSDGNDRVEPEGPPPGVRTMAMFRWLLIATMGLVAVLSVAYSFGLLSAGAASASSNQYYCPMHPQIVNDGPGECPICSMSLVPKPDGTGKPAVKSEPAPISHEGHRHHPADPYICPMHPEETGENSDARCPICKMKLEKRPPAASSTRSPVPPASASALPAAAPSAALAPGVPGLVPVELTLDRVQLIGMRTAPATAEALVPELKTVGIITADEGKLARVHSRFSGWVEVLAVKTTGEKVRRGQVLAGLYNLELLPAQQEFLTARRFHSGTTGGSSGATSGIGGSFEEDARQRLQLFGMSPGEIDAIAASGRPARTVAVTAPISGHVLRKSAVQGAYVEPGTELFEIADLTRVWVLADIYEYEMGRVSVGQPATVVVNAYPTERFTGKVTFVPPTLETGTRTLRVRLELDNGQFRLRPGMYGDVTIQLGAAEGVVIPVEALVDTGEYQYVFIAKEAGRFEPRRVRAGTRSGDKIQIIEGVAAGELVVTTANFLLDSESRLRATVEGR
jgi:membrane fusion protein, copper/silver efflux system